APFGDIHQHLGQVRESMMGIQLGAKWAGFIPFDGVSKDNVICRVGHCRRKGISELPSLFVEFPHEEILAALGVRWERPGFYISNTIREVADLVESVPRRQCNLGSWWSLGDSHLYGEDVFLWIFQMNLISDRRTGGNNED